MRLLFLFLDGVGLGKNDPSINPFAQPDHNSHAVSLPNLTTLLDGWRLTKDITFPLETQRATLISLDPCMGVEGLPQSATGQASLLTGQNIPAALGYHYGPKPDAAVTAYLSNGNLFNTLRQAGREVALLNAYPPSYFQAIKSGRRLPGAIAMAAYRAGVALKTAADLYAGQALSADFTAQGWRERLGYLDAPLLTPIQAGKQLAQLASEVDFSLFEYWPSDLVGHSQDMAQAYELLDILDQVLGGLLGAWQDRQGLFLITSDHGNLEDMSTHRHTLNPVPALLIGAPELRHRFLRVMQASNGTQVDLSLADVAPAIQEFICNS
jgi:2,3-bisphosphoglycerate-independent phosphoglycerate mutase